MPVQTKIQIRRDTATNWSTTNPTLASGEIGFDTTNNQMKIGNGSTAWNSLDYASGGASVEVSQTAPASPDVGNVWYNSTEGTSYIYYDNFWVPLSPALTGPAGKFTTSDTAPASPTTGDGWFDSSTAKLFIYYDSFWVEATSNRMGPTGEPGIAIQTSAPADTDVLWLDSDDPADAVAVPAGGSTGQVLAKATGTDYDTAWTTLPTPPSGNAIINGAFEINQRNFSSTTTNAAYGFDRWDYFYSSGTVTYSAQAFTPGAAPVAGYEATNHARILTSGQSGTSATAFFRQPIENVRTFANQTVTVSFWAKAATGTPSVSIELDQQFGSGGSTRVTTLAGKVTLSTSWARYTATVAVPSISGKTIGTSSFLGTHLWVSAGSDFDARLNTLGVQNNTFDIWGVQVEAGSTATAFRRNANSLQGELAACQRYYNKVGGFQQVAGQGPAASTTVAVCVCSLPTTLRVAPTSVESSNLVLHSPGIGDTTVTSVTLDSSSSTNNGVVVANVSSGLTQFRPYILRGAASGSPFLAFNAEL